MPRGAYTAKQERKAEHIEEGYEKRGVSKERQRSALGGRSTSRIMAARTPAMGGRPAAAKPPRRVGKHAGGAATADDLGRAFQDFDRTLDRAEFTMRQAFQPSRDRILPSADW